MKKAAILNALEKQASVPPNTHSGRGRRNKKRVMAETFATAAESYFEAASHPTFEAFKRRTIQRRFYGITPITWLVWAIRLASWAKAIWDIWQSQEGDNQ